MNTVRNEKLPDREHRQIRKDLEKNYECPTLRPDPPMMHVPGLNWGLISCISPFSGTENAEMKDIDDFLAQRRLSKVARIQLMRMMYEKMKILLKFRGAFKTQQEADQWAETRIGVHDGIETFSFKLYEYGFFPPSKYSRPEEMEVNYLDKEAQSFYRKEKMKKEEESRVFERRMEIFRENVQKNNAEFAKLTDEERKKIEGERLQEKYKIQGVEIEKILNDDKMKRVMTQDTFNTIRDLSDIIGVEPEKFYEAWARNEQNKKDEEAKEKNEEDKNKIEEVSVSSGVSTKKKKKTKKQ